MSSLNHGRSIPASSARTIRTNKFLVPPTEEDLEPDENKEEEDAAPHSLSVSARLLILSPLPSVGVATGSFAVGFGVRGIAVGLDVDGVMVGLHIGVVVVGADGTSVSFG